MMAVDQRGGISTCHSSISLPEDHFVLDSVDDDNVSLHGESIQLCFVGMNRQEEIIWITSYSVDPERLGDQLTQVDLNDTLHVDFDEEEFSSISRQV